MKSLNIDTDVFEPDPSNWLAKTFLIVGIIGAFFHTYFVTFGFGVPFTGNAGITGQAITEEIGFNLGGLSLASRLIIAGEWLFVLGVLLYLLIKGRLMLQKDLKKGIGRRAKKIQSEKGRYETDLDIFYEILQEKKVLRVSVLSRIFGIPNKTAIEWCNILEEGNIASLTYPIVGGPKVYLASYLKELEEKKKKEKLKKDGEKEKEKPEKKGVQEGQQKESRKQEKEKKRKQKQERKQQKRQQKKQKRARKKQRTSKSKN